MHSISVTGLYKNDFMRIEVTQVPPNSQQQPLNKLLIFDVGISSTGGVQTHSGVLLPAVNNDDIENEERESATNIYLRDFVFFLLIEDIIYNSISIWKHKELLQYAIESDRLHHFIGTAQIGSSVHQNILVPFDNEVAVHYKESYLAFYYKPDKLIVPIKLNW